MALSQHGTGTGGQNRKEERVDMVLYPQQVFTQDQGALWAMRERWF